MHLGDYIYDFVDEDEEVRVPSPTLQCHPIYKSGEQTCILSA